MTRKRLFLAILSTCILQNYLHAQEKSNIRFGKVSASEFVVPTSNLDSGTAAVVIADIGEAHYIGAGTGGIWFNYTRTRRIKILNRKGFNAATVYIPLFIHSGGSQRLSSLKAFTYNLDNGQIIQTKLDQKSVFTEHLNKDILLEKFTFPALQDGAVIEYEYSIESAPTINLPSWEFQGSYPCLWSEYNVSIPDFLTYAFCWQGYQTLYINKNSRNTSHPFGVPVPVNEYRWVVKDVPALKEENYTSTINNHISKVECQLASIEWPNGYSQDIMSNWSKISEELMKDAYFGAELNEANRWMNDEMASDTKGATDNLEKCRRIYAFVRNKFSCSQYFAYRASHSLKSTFNDRTGTVADINLLLVALLNHEGIPAWPVILSTRDHGYTHPVYPLLNRYNYVICAASIGSSTYFLDGSNKSIGFNHLPAFCYNGQAMLINTTGSSPINLAPDSIREKKISSVFISNDEKGGSSGSFESTVGDNESLELREKLRKETLKSYFDDLQAGFQSDMIIKNPGIDSLSDPDQPLKIHYDFDLKSTGTTDILYFKPILTGTFKENPFSSEMRAYPVEMPSLQDKTYVLDMEIPQGYDVDELPASLKLSLNEADGFYEYRLDKTETNIRLISRIKIEKAVFLPEEYKGLRDFFALVIKKQGEQIVFKKK